MPGTAYPGVVDDVSWGALAMSLTVLGGIYTWWALRHRGFTAAVRAAGFTLLPLAAWMTGLLQVFGDVADSFAHWFTRLVFSPTVWLGVIVFVVAVVMIGGANAVSRTTTPDPLLIDDEMAEIQAILKKRGIS